MSKPLKEGKYEKDKLEIVEVKRKSVIPYEDIEKALKEGKAYVLPSKTSKNTINQARKRLIDKFKLKDIKLGLTKDTKQFVFYVE